MHSEANPTVYVRLRKRIRRPRTEPIRLGHIAQIIIDADWEETVRELEVYRPDERDGTFILIDIMRVVAALKQSFPGLAIEHFGEPHVLVDLFVPSSRVRKPSMILFIAMCILLFIGSGLAIMNFHEDVSMPEVHRRIYQLITGLETEHPYLLQVPYSIGLGLGMILFFNQWFKKKFSEEPSPLEVEMYMYQESVNQYMIAAEYRKMHRDREPL